MRENDARKLNHKTLEEIRIRAVERVQAGESPEVVIKALGFSRTCIYNWLSMYRTGGLSALKAKALAGRPRNLSGEQMQRVYQMVAGKSPLQYRFEFALWTREMVQILIRDEMKKRLSLSSVGRLLRQLGLSCQRPLTKAYEQNPGSVRAWLSQEYPAIREMAKKEGAQIFFGDEAGIRSDYHSGTTWGVRGQTPVVKATGKRFSINMLSAISARGLMRFMVVDGKVDSTVFVDFLKRLIHNQPQPVFLILDGHPVHKSRAVNRFVQSTEGKLRLFLLPPYSPELNPDEQVWNKVKNHGVGRRVVKTKDELKKIMSSLLRRLQKSPMTIKMFFLLPDTQYAAC